MRVRSGGKQQPIYRGKTGGNRRKTRERLLCAPMRVPQRPNVIFDGLGLHYLAGFDGAVHPVIFKPFAKLAGKRRQGFRDLLVP